MTRSRLATQFIRTAAGSYVPGGNGRITRVVVHRMEAPMKAGTAVAVARYFASGAGGRGVSCHYSLDPSVIVASAEEEDRCFHAPPNGGSVGIEQAGYASTDDWGTEAGKAMLARTVALTRDICDRHGLPKVWLSAADLRAGKSGVTSHHQVSLAFGQSSHTDPDPHFPVSAFIRAVAGPQPAPIPTPEDDMPLTADDVHKVADETVKKITATLWDFWNGQYAPALAEITKRLEALETETE